jgi:transcriptional antiterminator NusG
LSQIEATSMQQIANAESPAVATGAAPRAWHALWTRSHCEVLVQDQLLAKGFHPFVPRIASWSTRGGKVREIAVPMFPGYLFLPDALDKHAYIEVRKSRGLVSLLGAGWDRLAVIPEREMQAIEQLQAAGVPVKRHPYLQTGRRVRVTRGPLAGCEGILVELKASRGRLIVSIELLQRSVSAEVDCSAVTAA